MTEAIAEPAPHAEPHVMPRVPWWNIESPLRRRIKGRYVRRVSLAVAILNIALVAYAPRLMVPDEARDRAATVGLRAALPEPVAPHEALARMAAIAP